MNYFLLRHYTKWSELETADDYYEYQCNSEQDIIQEMPDAIGTHAVV